MKKILLITSYLFVILLSSCEKDDSNDNTNNNDPQNVGGSGCGGQTTFTDPRDGQTYNIVQIGNQCWFAENLNYATGNSWCYDDNSANCNTYGRLYDWQTALTACPSGWHLPSDAEWTILTDYLGGSNVAGGKMKSTTGWDSPNTEATNSSGFSGLPGGYRDGDYGTFSNLGKYGYWWSSTQNPTLGYWQRHLRYTSGGVVHNYKYELDGLCVRCLRD